MNGEPQEAGRRADTDHVAVGIEPQVLCRQAQRQWPPDLRPGDPLAFLSFGFDAAVDRECLVPCLLEGGGRQSESLSRLFIAGGVQDVTEGLGKA